MIEIRVVGLPAPQGSKQFRGFAKNGKPIIADDCERTKPWQETVKWAAIEGKRCGAWSHMLMGAVAIEITFTMPKPKSSPKTRKTWPTSRPDLDKCERSSWDALVQIGLIEDDSCIVENRSRKVFPREHPDALDVPGAVIRLWPMAEWTGYQHHSNLQQEEFALA